jgi:hypothetical protein
VSFSDAGGADDVEEIDLPVFVNDQPTVHAASIGTTIIQVTNTQVRYSASESGEVKTWEHAMGKKITLAAHVGSTLLLSLEGGMLVVLRFDGEAFSHITCAFFSCLAVDHVQC